MSDVAGELARLQELRDKGTISPADFDTMKGDVLRRATSPEVVAAPLMPSASSTPRISDPSKPAARRKNRVVAIVGVVVAVLVVGVLILQAV